MAKEMSAAQLDALAKGRAKRTRQPVLLPIATGSSRRIRPSAAVASACWFAFAGIFGLFAWGTPGVPWKFPGGGPVWQGGGQPGPGDPDKPPAEPPKEPQPDEPADDPKMSECEALAMKADARFVQALEWEAARLKQLTDSDYETTTCYTYHLGNQAALIAEQAAWQATEAGSPAECEASKLAVIHYEEWKTTGRWHGNEVPGLPPTNDECFVQLGGQGDDDNGGEKPPDDADENAEGPDCIPLTPLTEAQKNDYEAAITEAILAGKPVQVMTDAGATFPAQRGATQRNYYRDAIVLYAFVKQGGVAETSAYAAYHTKGQQCYFKSAPAKDLRNEIGEAYYIIVNNGL